MAAIYSGVHLKLRSPRTPWEDKLKLARFAWVSPQCFLPNKEQVLLDWVSHALIGYYGKKFELQQHLVDGLWAYLDDILHSKKLQGLLNKGKTISLRFAMAQVINERISESAGSTSPLNVSPVLSCCQSILSSAALSVTYTAKYELMIELLGRLCALACSLLPSRASEEPLRLRVFEVLLVALSSYLVVQKQQGNANRVFAQVTSHLLPPFLFLRHLLMSRTGTAEDGIAVRQHLGRDTRGKLEAVLQSALFLPDHLPSYSEELLRGKEAAGAKKAAVSKGLLSPVRMIIEKLGDAEFCDPTVGFIVRANSLPLLFKFSLDAFCKGGQNQLVGFHLLARFVAALGLFEERSVEELSSAGNWNVALLSLENLLNLSLSADLYNVAADRIHHSEAQFLFYRKVAQFLFNNVQPTIPAWYRCLKALLLLNHLIVEPDLDELVSSAWIDADCNEPRVQKAREALLGDLLQVYAKLRQLPRLFDEVLVIICRPAADDLRPPVLSAGVCGNLSKCLLDVSPGQSLEICSMILEKCHTYLLPDLQGKDDMALKLFSLSLVLHFVLFNVKCLDNSTPAPIVKRSQSLLGEMLGILRPLIRLLQEHLPGALWIEKVREAALLLSYTWVEVDTLCQLHCSKYVSPADPSDSLVTDEGTALLPGMSAEGWDALAPKDHNCSPVSQLLLELLALQKIKKLSLRMDLAPDPHIQDSLCKSAEFILRSGNGSLTQLDSKLWDTQISSVDANTYPAAHWFLVTSNLALITPYLSDEDLSDLANALLSSVLHRDASGGEEEQGTCLSVSLISKHLLNSMILVELPSVYSAFVRCVSRKIIRILCASKQGPQNEGLQLLATLDSSVAGDEKGGTVLEASSHTRDPAAAWTRLETAAQEILRSSKTCDPIVLSESQLESLLELLQVARTLNPDGLSPEDHTEFALLLFFMATNIYARCDTESAKTVGLLQEVYLLLASMQSGRNMGSILRVVHGSDFLEAVMVFLFSLSKKHLFGAVENSAWLAFLHIIQNFLQCFIEVIIERRKSVRLNLEKFVSVVISGDVASAILSKQQVGAHGPGCVQLLLASLATLCKVMISHLDKSKQLEDTLSGLLERVTDTLGPVIQTCLKSQSCSMLGQSFSVSMVTVLLEAELARGSSESPEGECQERQCLRYSGLYWGFAQQILRELSSSPRPLDFLNSALRFLTAFCPAAERTKEPGLDSFYMSTVQNVKNLLTAPWLSLAEVRKLETPLQELLEQLESSSTQEQFRFTLLALRDGMGASWLRSGRTGEVFSSVMLTKLLVSCPMEEDCAKVFWFLAPQIISTLVSVLKEAGKEVALTPGLAVPALEAVRALLRQGEGLITNPHHVTVVFSALQSVPLDHLTVQDYYAVFLAIHEVLFTVIQCHPQVVLKATPCFLNCFFRLIASIMHEGRQKAEDEKGSEAEFELLLKCAQLVERMCSHIATVAEQFTVLCSFIIAQYVSELQKVTLHPKIKSHLTEGVYKILDLCIEQDLKFLNTALQAGVKEVLNELYSSYTRYHKTQRQGEEKYTA
ncbi:unhealthy ribosome biogenesis protein 2 homolog [Lepisosteus oculatus]|uniref:unhealthy ribosome biogenesis protein 2 homolog n=1 Tax=Lepisosteus oculatus TaxID=7918 RepID=UPI0035F5250C